MTIGDREQKPGEVEGYYLSSEQDDAIGREMWEVRQALKAADVQSAWVPTPCGLEQYPCVPMAGSTVSPLYVIGMHENDEGMPRAYLTYTDLRGREVLPMFTTPGAAAAYVENQTSRSADGTRPLGMHELGGLGALVEALVRVDLAIIDPDHVAHPGRCATERLGQVVRGGAEVVPR